MVREVWGGPCPVIPRGASLSDSYKTDRRCFFQSGLYVDYIKILYILSSAYLHYKKPIPNKIPTPNFFNSNSNAIPINNKIPILNFFNSNS